MISIQILNFMIQFLTAYLMSDFAVGIYHWVKDTYFKFDTPFIGPAFVTPSRTHHIKPRHVTEFSDAALLWNSVKWMIPTYIPFFYYFGVNTFTATFFIIVALNDVIHKYAHFIDKERHWFPTVLQQLYITQTYGEHHYHHTAPHDCNYCPITPWVNYPLEKYQFWRRLENLIEKCTGVKPRDYELKYEEDESYPAGVKFIN